MDASNDSISDMASIEQVPLTARGSRFYERQRHMTAEFNALFYLVNMFDIPSVILTFLGMVPTDDPTEIENYNGIRDLCRTIPRLPRSSLRPNWTCDWESYQDIYMFLVDPDYYDLSYIDMTMSCLYDLPVPIRPIAYDRDSSDHSFIFEAGGQYYMYLTGAEQLSRFEAEGLTDENAVSVGVGSEYKILDEVEDGGRSLNDLEREQRRMASRLASGGGA